MLGVNSVLLVWILSEINYSSSWEQGEASAPQALLELSLNSCCRFPGCAPECRGPSALPRLQFRGNRVNGGWQSPPSPACPAFSRAGKEWGQRNSSLEVQDLCTTWSLRQFSLEFLPSVLSSALTATLCTGCQGSVGLWLSCPQVDLCWQGVCNAVGWATKGKGTMLGAGIVGPLTYICLVLLSSRSPPGGEAVGCSRQSASSLCCS